MLIPIEREIGHVSIGRWPVGRTLLHSSLQTVLRSSRMNHFFINELFINLEAFVRSDIENV